MIRARQYSVTGACMRGETQNVSYGEACRLRNQITLRLAGDGFRQLVKCWTHEET